jgi:hypothetical protein
MKFNQSRQKVCPDSGCSKLLWSLNLLPMSTSHACNFLNLSIEPVEIFGLKWANGRCFPLGHHPPPPPPFNFGEKIGWQHVVCEQTHLQGRWCEKLDSNFHWIQMLVYLQKLPLGGTWFLYDTKTNREDLWNNLVSYSTKQIPNFIKYDSFFELCQLYINYSVCLLIQDLNN